MSAGPLVACVRVAMDCLGRFGHSQEHDDLNSRCIAVTSDGGVVTESKVQNRQGPRAQFAI